MERTPATACGFAATCPFPLADFHAGPTAPHGPAQEARLHPILGPVPIGSDLDAARLTIHSVGDHSMQDGLAQLTAIQGDARSASRESGVRCDLVFDMTR